MKGILTLSRSQRKCAWKCCHGCHWARRCFPHQTHRDQANVQTFDYDSWPISMKQNYQEQNSVKFWRKLNQMTCYQVGKLARNACLVWKHHHSRLRRDPHFGQFQEKSKNTQFNIAISIKKQVRHAKQKLEHVFRLPTCGVDMPSTTWAVSWPGRLEHSLVDLSFAH